MMYSAYNLNKQSDNIEPGRTAYLEPVHCSMSGSNLWHCDAKGAVEAPGNMFKAGSSCREQLGQLDT